MRVCCVTIVFIFLNNTPIFGQNNLAYMHVYLFGRCIGGKMQIYLTFCDYDNDFLIVKKREFNKWWGGQVSSQNSLVNQAGQWAFPGGKCECGSSGDDHSADAKREFKEETGLDFPAAAQVYVYKDGRNQFQLYVYRVKSMTEMVRAICKGATPNSAAGDRPTNLEIKDWELGEAQIVPRDKLTEYLGKRNTNISKEAEQSIQSARKYSQSIDWYAEMATALQRADLGPKT
jgi:ADP-ribose pyrophosphatase YjhB (NUDIX family)